MDKDMAKKMAMVSSEEEEEEEGGGDTKETVCLQVRNFNPYPIRFWSSAFQYEGHNWYVLDLDNNAAEEIQDMSRHVHRFTTSACVKSTVYVFGGENLQIQMRKRSEPNAKGYLYDFVDPIVPDLWYTDIHTYIGDDDGGFIYKANSSSSNSSWTEGASMRHPRSGACAVVVDDKIYVFGGVESPSSHAWAEFYDTKFNRWSLLTPSPDMISLNVCRCVVFQDQEKKKNLILVYTPENRSLYSYDVILENWELFDSNFGLWESELVVVSVSVSSSLSSRGSGSGSSSPVLFTIKDGLLYGYHLGLRKWFDDPVSGLESNNALPDPDFLDFVDHFNLVRLGYRRSNEKLCVIWSFYPRDHSGLCVHCTKLSVFQEDAGQSSLVAKVESTNAFKLDDGDTLISCLALTTCRGRKRAGESLYMEEEEKKKNKP